MSEMISFTKDDFISLGIKEDLVNIIFQEIPTQSTKIDRIIIIGQQIEKIIRNILIINEKTNRRTIGVFTSSNEDYNKQVMQMGMAYIFELRHFLLDDEIEFSIGGLYTDKETGNTILAEKHLSQREMLLNIRASLNSRAMVLQGHLERFENQNIVNNNTIAQMWQQILSLSETADFNYVKGSPYRLLSPGKKTRYYQNPNADLQVWLRYVGKSHRVLTYYLKNGLTYFNRGWLYEWFKSYTVTSEHIFNLAQSLNKGSFEPIVGKMDTVAGYKGGDYSLGEGKGSVQAKYGNDQIISFSSIVNVILEINAILQNFKNIQNKEELKEMANKLFELFTDPSTVNSLSLGVSKTTERIMKILENKEQEIIIF